MSTGQKKFGTFAGVFTPSILTILGVIMYMRMGWVVGNAGLWGTILIVVLAHAISASTGLSISSIATDKKVGAGGVYYVLSRSLGLPIGGAIGLTLFVGTAFSIALYLVGFSESLNAYIGLDTSINGLRSSASLALLALTIIAFISTSVAIKTQFFILIAIILSLVSIFFGTSDFAPETVTSFSGEDSASLEEVFAIFFPAVTGFTAGIAMSGDLRDPKQSIPSGTIASIVVGFLVYFGLAFFIAYNVSPEILRSDNNILIKIAWFAPIVVAGVWGATLSSALGGILGGPRILQAMSVDKITPAIFGKGVGKSNEPRNALILTVIVAEAGILIGELDLIARVVSMFYLAAYGFINISFFLESWASADFKPSFKVNKLVGLFGFIATFAIMFKLDMLAMVAAIVIIGGIYLWLARRQITLGTGDIWQSVWSTVVKTGLKRMEAKDDHKRNWKPNILLFSGNSEARPYLLEFSKALAGQAGIVTNFDLVENKEAKVLFPKHKQSVKDEILQKYDIFGRRVEVKNVFKGIETIATTFGFSGLDPNTALMGWARNTEDPIWFAQMTQKLIDLDYNVLYLDYDKRWGFRKREKIDLWWRGVSNNAELMLHLAKFITVSPEWRNAEIRILLVNDYNVDRKIIENRIEQLLEEFRVHAEINIINNIGDKKPFYELMKVVSADADLVFIGIPNISPGKEASFVEKTNNLVSIIGTTLLVKASSTFEVTHLGMKELEEKPDIPLVRQLDLEPLMVPKQETLANALYDLDDQLENSAKSFSENILAVLQQHYLQFIIEIEESLSTLFLTLKKEEGGDLANAISETLKKMVQLSELFRNEELELLKNVLSERIEKFQKSREGIIASAPATLTINFDNSGNSNKKIRKIRWKKALLYYHRSSGIHSILQAMYDLGMVNLSLLGNCRRIITRNIKELQRGVESGGDSIQVIEKTAKKTSKDFNKLRQLADEIVQNPFYYIRKTDREICNLLATEIPKIGFNKSITSKNRKLKRKKFNSTVHSTQQFAHDWERNQLLLHHRFETGLLLAGVIAALKGFKNEAFNEIQHGFVEKIKTKLHLFETTIPAIRECLEKKEFENISNTHIHFEEDDFANPDHIFFRLTESIAEFTSNLPEEVELMDARSFNSFNEEQGDSISVDGLSIDKIADFLIETNFVAPFQKKLLSFTNEMNQLNGKIVTRINLLNYGIESVEEETDLLGLPEILQQAEKELANGNESADLLFESFIAEIGEKLEATEPTLDIRSITEQASQLAQYVRKERRRKGISMSIQNLENNLQQKVRQFREFVSEKRQDVALVNFEKRHAALRSAPVILRSFTENVDISPGADEKLPFYYKQLFSGKHLNPGRKIDNRQREVREVERAIRHIREGVAGGIMVTGEALSGKSFFCEHIAYQIIGGEVFHVTPPAGGAVSIMELQKAFQSATAKKGTLKSILQTLPSGTVFILDDIEMWWLKTEGGNQIIEQLAKTIEEFGSRHFFLLNCNLQTYSLLSQATGLLRCLVSTIILAPMSKEELRKIIWTRHKTGGLVLQYKDIPEDELSEKNLNRLFSRFLNLSGGHPGFALRLWLSAITNYHDGVIALEYPVAYEFPELESAAWKSLLLQFFLHQSLSRKRLFKLYEGEDKKWVSQMIAEIKKSGIIEEPLNDIFSLKDGIKPYLENWLKEKEIIK